MNAIRLKEVDTPMKLIQAIENACAKVAPTWPLDQSIAVNPWWQWRDSHIATVSASLKAMGNVKMLMPASYYQSFWGNRIQEQHLMQAKEELVCDLSIDTLIAFIHQEEPSYKAQWRHLGELLDLDPSHIHKMPWHEEIVQQISQFCALYFQYPEQMRYTDGHENNLYNAWREVVNEDKGISILMDAPHFHDQIETLPYRVEEIYQIFWNEFGLHHISESILTEYVYSLLLDIYGWASWMAYEGWQANLNGLSSDLLKQLIGIRMAWEILLFRHVDSLSHEHSASIKLEFAKQFEVFEASKMQWQHHQSKLWVWHRAFEISYQQPLQQKLIKNIDTPKHTPSLQAVFCIDVRSEPMRRALESQHPDIQTYGFAGFFGLPIAYKEQGSNALMPQLPGLLKPSLVVQHRPAAHPKKAKGKINWKSAFDTAPSSFGLVESLGLFKLTSLFRPTECKIASFGEGTWEISKDGKALSIDEIATIAAGILKSIGFQNTWSKFVLFVAHGSQSTNNPHASGLDCGACGGQSGEINVRVLAQTLNNLDVRNALKAHEIVIPNETVFVGALHNTTTDEIRILDQTLPQSIKDWLENAKNQAQVNRAPKLGVEFSSTKALNRLFENRTKDWAELRPEWGLTNNAAFIVAPRHLTKNIDLDGRCFLHDYDQHDDTDSQLLEQIMTAPMIVTNWINLQYYASVTDNLTYGSGNKMLHNIVAHHIGVFEGNGGDLRIGLPMQSIHDGKNWRHEPIRLHVYIAAPLAAIDRIIQKHAMIKSLVENEWLFIYQIGDKQIKPMQYKSKKG